jgi:hypothetical protein
LGVLLFETLLLFATRQNKKKRPARRLVRVLSIALFVEGSETALFVPLPLPHPMAGLADCAATLGWHEEAAPGTRELLLPCSLIHHWATSGLMPAAGKILATPHGKALVVKTITENQPVDPMRIAVPIAGNRSSLPNLASLIEVRITPVTYKEVNIQTAESSSHPILTKSIKSVPFDS